MTHNFKVNDLVRVDDYFAKHIDDQIGDLTMLGRVQECDGASLLIKFRNQTMRFHYSWAKKVSPLEELALQAVCSIQI